MSGSDLSGKVALLTGVAGNLGSAAAEAFFCAGARCALVDRDLARLARSYPHPDPRRLLLAADLLDQDSVTRAVDAAAATFGRIDIVCNIAGGFTAGTPVHETPAATWRAMFDLNAMSVVHVAHAVVPRMIAAGGGSIVNVAAASATRGAANMAAYVVSKSAVVRITESMAAELGPHGIAVRCIMPTTIDTPQNRAAMAGADTRLWITPSAIAEALLFLASPAVAFSNGSALPLGDRPGFG